MPAPSITTSGPAALVLPVKAVWVVASMRVPLAVIVGSGERGRMVNTPSPAWSAGIANRMFRPGPRFAASMAARRLPAPGGLPGTRLKSYHHRAHGSTEKSREKRVENGEWGARNENRDSRIVKRQSNGTLLIAGQEY
jgi:hypothetical protein